MTLNSVVAKRVALLQRGMAGPLVKWYRRTKRDLPWRGTVDPYAIWLSEMMLQQTQVATVIPFYHRFLERFPTVGDLAAADLQEVFKSWAGLGYYRRAKHLHAAAKAIMSDHGGAVPQTLEGLLTLPGVGRYSAGAIASFAFGLSHPIVDGNVMRVLSRLLNSDANIAQPATQKMLWHVAEKLTPKNDPGTYNQAIMELGALVCVPKNPACLLCPLNEICAAFSAGTQQTLPIKSKAAPTKKLILRSFVLHRGTDVLLLQRPKGVTWEDLWEFPALTVPSRLNSLAQLADVVQEQLGLTVDLSAACGTVHHQLTHRHMTYRVYRGKVRTTGGVRLPVCDKQRNYQAFAWVSAVDTRPVGRITHKIADVAEAVSKERSG